MIFILKGLKGIEVTVTITTMNFAFKRAIPVLADINIFTCHRDSVGKKFA